MPRDVTEALRAKLRDDMNVLADAAATGKCQSFEAYKFLCGQIHGLAIAERHLLDLLSHQETEDDE